MPDDYLALHEFMDSSKLAIADNRHRMLTHQSWFIKQVLPKVFGDYLVVTTTDEGAEIDAQIAQKEREITELREKKRASKLGRVISVAQIGETHVLEDYGNKFIPTPQDFVEAGEMRLVDWMQNGRSGHPPSFDALAASRTKVSYRLD